MRKLKLIHEAKLTKGELPKTRSALLVRIKRDQTNASEVEGEAWRGPILSCSLLLVINSMPISAVPSRSALFDRCGPCFLGV
jgi:hypothetical protein